MREASAAQAFSDTAKSQAAAKKLAKGEALLHTSPIRHVLPSSVSSACDMKKGRAEGEGQNTDGAYVACSMLPGAAAALIEKAAWLSDKDVLWEEQQPKFSDSMSHFCTQRPRKHWLMRMRSS